MSRKKPVALPADLVYLYDGSLPGFYCCVYESVYGRCLPADIQPLAEAQPSLFETRLIETDPEKARRVRNSVHTRISRRAQELVETVFLSCLDGKERKLLVFLLHAYGEGPRALSMLGHPDVAPVLEAERHLYGEQHLLLGFVRFSDYGGVLAATITPKNFILPFLADHFCQRFSQEDFLIFDKNHKAALVYQKGRREIIPLEGIRFPDVDETEEKYRALWKRFYKTIAIKARENHKCRRTHMPLRYWENMLEVQDELEALGKGPQVPMLESLVPPTPGHGASTDWGVLTQMECADFATDLRAFQGR